MYNATIAKIVEVENAEKFFEVQDGCNRLDKAGNPLLQLGAMVKWLELQLNHIALGAQKNCFKASYRWNNSLMLSF